MLALFDLDETLIRGDSATEWIRYCVEHGLASSDMLARMRQFAQQYEVKAIDMASFAHFFLSSVKGKDCASVESIVLDFISQRIKPIVYDRAFEILHSHSHDRRILISATFDFLVRPIGTFLGFDEVIASSSEIDNGLFTGRFKGILSFAQGKVERLRLYLKDDFERLLLDSCFYSDSVNDIPLLSTVKIPIACNPDAMLRQHAIQQQWQCIDL